MSQLGRISGPLLKSNLIRNGVNLAFETNLLYLDVNNKRIGINVVDPLDTINELTHDLTVNGVTRTSTIDITGGSVNIGNITISGDTIQSSTGVLNLIGAANGSVIYQSKLLVDDFKIENNIISTTTSNANIELRPHGTGTVEIFGNTNVTGNITATGNISAGGNIQIGSTDQTIPNNDTVTFNAEISSDVIPDVTDTHSLGSSDNRWRDLWVKNLDADSLTSGSLVIDGIDLALTQGKIYYVADNGSDTNVGQHQNDPFATIKKALTEATSEDTVYIYPGTYIEQFPLIVPVGVTVKGSGIRSVKIVPTAATRYNDAFLLNGEATIEDLTVADFFSGGNFFTVTAASFESTTINVGTAPFAHTYVSGGTINIGGTDYSITNAVYTHTTGVVVLSHTGGTATPSTTVFLSNLTFSCNGGNRVFPDNGYAFRFATDFTVTSRSPYVRNITVLTKGSVTSVSDPLGYNEGDAGKGAYIDGAYATAMSKEASMLFHSATFICPGVDIIIATNGARIEWLNCFTYFADKGMHLYSSNDGFAGAGLTRLKLPAATRTGTWAVGNTVSYYGTDGTTVLTSGTVDSVDGDWINLTGRVQGFLIPDDRAPKTLTLNGNAKLSTAEKKFGTASLILDGTGDYISHTSITDFGFGTGDFTIEGWFYKTAALSQILVDTRTTATENSIMVQSNSGGNLRLFVNGVFVLTSSNNHTLNTWNHLAISRVSGVTRFFINGVVSTNTYADATDYGTTKPLVLGASFVGLTSFSGYIDDFKISKGVGRYTTTFTALTSPFTSDLATVLLLHFNGLNNSTNVVDDGVTFVDVRSSAGGTTTDLAVADYSDFGAEVRSIGSAAVYGNYGIYGDGVGVIAYLIGQNLAYIGNGKSTTNDPNTVIQANEIVELNGAKIYYQSVDHKGDFRIGDLFYVNQETGEVTFSNSNVTIGTSLTFDDGAGNVTYLDASKIETGDFRISGNTIETLTQDFNIQSALNLINLQSNVTITGNLDVTGDVTIGGNILIGDQSTDTVSFVAGVNSDILPNNPLGVPVYNLGTVSQQWLNLYASQISIADVQIDTNVIRTTATDTDLTLQANGSGRIYIPLNDVQISQNLTVNGTTTLADTDIGTVGTPATVTHVGNVTQTGNLTQTGNIDLTGTLTTGSYAQFADIRIQSNELKTTLLNNDLTLGAAGTGKIYIPSNDVQIDQNLTVTGYIDVTTLDVDTTISSDVFSTGDILIDNNTIYTTLSNNNLVLQAAGTGKIYVPSNDVQFDQNLTVNGSTNLKGTTIVGTVTHTGNVTQVGNVTQTGSTEITGTLTVGSTAQFQDIKIDTNILTTTVGNNNLQLTAAGTGRIYVPTNNVTIENTLTVVGTSTTSTISNTGTVSSGTFTTSNISITSNNITSTVGDTNLVLEAAGAGKISVPSNNVQFDQGLTVNTNTNLKDTTIVGTVTHTGAVTQVGDLTQTGSTEITGTLTVGSTAQFQDIKVDLNVITTTIGNNNLVLEAAGTGRVIVPNDDVDVAQTLTVTGTTGTTTINNTGTVTSGTFTTGNISINGNTIQTTVGNSNLQLSAAGTGYIQLEQFDVQENEIRINTGSDLTLTPNGTGIVTVNSTQSIKIPVGDNAARPTGAAGMIRFNTDLTRYEGYNGTAWVRLDGVEDADGNTKITAELTPGANDNTIRFYADGTQVADLTSTRLNTNNIAVGAINFNNNVVSTTTTNTDLLLSPNGTGQVRIGNFAFSSNIISNTVNNSVTVISQTGDGYVKINSTGGFVIPVGRTDQRPSVYDTGMMRFNSSDQRVEIWNGTAWVGVAQGGAGGGVTQSEATDISILSAIIFG